MKFRKTIGLSLLAVSAFAFAQDESDSVPIEVGESIVDEMQAESANRPDIRDFELYLDGVMATQFTEHDLAGVTFSLVLDGELALAKGYGFADLEARTPVDPAVHMFRPGSVSKLLTWTAVMQLYEQGKLELDVPVSQYIDQFEMPNEFGDITMQHILTHAVGLEDGGAGYLFADSPEDIIPLAESLGTYKPGQFWEPGVVSAYSNWTTSVAGLVVANISGLKFENYVDQYILEPLEMRTSSFHEPLPEGIIENMATGYFQQGKGLEVLGYEHIANFGPAGALAATATDMANFITAFVNGGEFNGERILKSETVDLMLSPLLSQHEAIPAFAHGFYERRRNGQRFVEHGGDTIAFHSMLTIDPENGFGFFISYNAPEGAVGRGAVINAVIDYFYPPQEFVPVPTLEGSAERIAKIVGAYRVNRRSHSKLEAIVGLGGDMTIGPVGDASIVVPSPLSTAVYDEIEPWLFRERNSDGLLFFETDEAGAVLKVHLSAAPMMAMDKIAWYQTGANHQLVIGLALLAALFVLINAIRNRKAIKQESGLSRNATRAAVGTSLSALLFVIFMGVALAGADMAAIIFDFPPGGIGFALIFPIIGAILAVAMIYFTVMLWKDKPWGTAKRLRYTYITVVFVLFSLVLNFWNAIGWNYY